MREGSWRAVWLALAAVCLTSCGGVNSFAAPLLQEPQVLPPGHVRGAVGAQVGTTGGAPALGLRVGVAPRVEARAVLSGITAFDVGVNVHAMDRERVDLLLMPSFSSGQIGEFFDEVTIPYRAFALPAIFAVSLDEAKRYHVFAGPEARIGQRTRNVDAFWSSVGLHVGTSLSGPRDYVTVVPECAWLVTVSRSDSPHDDEHRLAYGHSLAQCSLGLTFGARHTRAE